MAIYRPIQISYWQDGYILALEKEEKLFYLYLLTNCKTSQCGIYELPLRILCNDLSLDYAEALSLIKKFEADNKISFDPVTETFYIRNWIKFNQITNINICKRVILELKEVKTSNFITEYLAKLKELNSNNLYNLNIEAAIKPLPSNKHKHKHKHNHNHNSSDSDSLNTEILLNEFVSFWNVYDKKVGDKEKVKKKFLSLSNEDRQKIKDTVEDYVRSTPDKKYRKNPETYLNNNSWNDEIINDNNGKTINNLQNFEPVSRL